MRLSLGRKSIVTVAIAGLDLPVLAMDQELRTLMPGDSPSQVHRFGLGIEDGGRPVCARSTDCPRISMGHNVLITLATHEKLPFLAAKNRTAMNLGGGFFKSGHPRLMSGFVNCAAYTN